MAHIQDFITPMIVMLHDTVDLERGADPDGPNLITSAMKSRDFLELKEKKARRREG